MGIILKNTPEYEIMKAHNLVVYGRINEYVWTLYDGKREPALTSMRIEDEEGHLLFSMKMGNRCILQSRIDDTLDNFLYWIATEQPDKMNIEKQVYESLFKSNSLFNYMMEQRKKSKKYCKKKKG